MKYELKLGIWNSIFCVPTAVADDCLKLARGNDLKVLLYLLRNAGAAFDSKDIAEYLSITDEQVEESVSFWTQRGIICIDENGELVPSVSKTDPAVKRMANNAPSNNMLDTVRKIELDRAPDFTPKEIASTVRGNKKPIIFSSTVKRFTEDLLNTTNNEP